METEDYEDTCSPQRNMSARRCLLVPLDCTAGSVDLLISFTSDHSLHLPPTLHLPSVARPYLRHLCTLGLGIELEHVSPFPRHHQMTIPASLVLAYAAATEYRHVILPFLLPELVVERSWIGVVSHPR